MSPSGTIIITAGNGTLGSLTALSLVKNYPDTYHLLLTARNLSDESVVATSAKLDEANASFSWLALDLLSFSSVRSVIAKVQSQVSDGTILQIKGLVNMAARSVYVMPPKSQDGLDVVYQTNTVSPFLLMTGLLPQLEASGSGLVVNVSSSTQGMGRIDYFSDGKEKPEGMSIGTQESLTMYGSSKLMIIMLGYETDRRLRAIKSVPSVRIVSLDPGGMTSPSRLSDGNTSYTIQVARFLSWLLDPVINMFSKGLVNSPQVAAKAISSMYREERDIGGKFLILDDVKSSSPLSMDVAKQGEVWRQVVKDLGLKENEIGL